MSPEVSERVFEEAIECALLQGGPECACPARRLPSARRRRPTATRRRAATASALPEDYDRALCLLPRDVVDFVLATQPKEWKKLEQHHGAGGQGAVPQAPRRRDRAARRARRAAERHQGLGLQVPARLLPAGERAERGDAAAARGEPLRRGAPAPLQRRRTRKSLDLVLFLNGIPIFTAELKNPLNGQDVEDAIRQYKTDRDPREPLFAYGRCLAHFAVDPDLVYVTTQLAGPKTRFLPFNQGKFGGAGNPPVPPTQQGLRHGLPLGGDLGARQRARPRAPVHPRGRGGRREGAARPASAS